MQTPQHAERDRSRSTATVLRAAQRGAQANAARNSARRGNCLRSAAALLGALSLFAAGCSWFKSASPAAASQPTNVAWSQVSVQLAARQPTGTWAAMTGEDGRTVYVAPEVLLDQRDILAARALHGKDGHVVEIEFTSAAAMKLADITGRNFGASLAFIVEGRLVTAPVIASRIDSGIAYLSADFSAKQADELAERIRKPAPAPPPAKRTDAKAPPAKK